MDKTIQYYDEHAGSYVNDTKNASMKYAYDRFLFYMPKEGKILDLGCGSGRDSLYFKNQGYEVDAADGSAEMAAAASAYTGLPVRIMRFDELSATQEYQGIWACASLLHCPYEELGGLFDRMLEALKWEGVIYASFKFGDFEGYRGERWFTDLNIERMAEILTERKNCLLLECWKSHDVRKERFSEMWLNFIIRRTVTDKEAENAV